MYSYGFLATHEIRARQKNSQTKWHSATRIISHSHAPKPIRMIFVNYNIRILPVFFLFFFLRSSPSRLCGCCWHQFHTDSAFSSLFVMHMEKLMLTRLATHLAVVAISNAAMLKKPDTEASSRPFGQEETVTKQTTQRCDI